MYFLNKHIAEQIIKHTTHIIKHNINVMNNQGIILASDDLARIGLIHEGVRLTIRQNKVNVIGITGSGIMANC